MTPAAIMAAFETSGPLPRAALRAAGEAREAMVPLFLDYIARLQTATVADLDRMNATLFLLHLLAEWRETRAYRPLARLFRRDPAFLDALLGDTITEGSARIMAGVCDGDLDPLFAVLLDRQADGFLRGEMFDTLAMLALAEPALRPRIAGFLADFSDRAGRTTGEEVWWAWAECIAALGLDDLEPSVRAAFDAGRITPDLALYEDFAEMLAATLAAGRPDWFTRMRSNTPITDTIAELEGWYCFSPEALAETAAARLNVLAVTRGAASDGAALAGPAGGRTGRNDPCPCGSGRKYKKCCMP